MWGLFINKGDKGSPVGTVNQVYMIMVNVVIAAKTQWLLLLLSLFRAACASCLAYIRTVITQKSASNTLGVGHDLRMSTWAYNPGPPPDFPYTKAVSGHSATIQLYGRSGKYPTLICWSQWSMEGLGHTYHQIGTVHLSDTRRPDIWRLSMENGYIKWLYKATV